MISAYGQLLGVRRARALVASSLLGRLATGAYVIPLVLLIQETTHSFALAGAAEAANLAAGAISAPARGRALDRYGSRVVIPRVALIRAGLLAAMWPGAHTRMVWAIVLLAVMAGAASPQLATAMRLQWQHLLGREDPRLEQAYAFEASAQVAMFVIGPLLAAAGLATIGPGATLAATGVFLIAGALVFGALALDDRAPGAGKQRRSVRVLALPGIQTLVLTALIADCALGMVDITVTAFAKRHGAPSAAGLLLALFALTSVLISAVLGARTWRMPARKRLAVLMGAAALLTPLLALGHSIAAIAGLLVLAGAPVDPMKPPRSSSSSPSRTDPRAVACAPSPLRHEAAASASGARGTGAAVRPALHTAAETSRAS